MSSRRRRIWSGVLFATVITGASVRSEGPSPAESLAKLKAGNATFVASPAEALPVDAARRTAAAKGPAPFAALLSCADAAVPPEVIFHAGLGDLFVVRAAGPITDRSVLASLEYAVEAMHVPLLLVMGHESCGVIRAGLDRAGHEAIGPNFAHVLKQMRPAAGRAAAQSDAARLRAAILDNVEEQINALLQDSTTIKRRAEEADLAIVGAYYELETGIVHFSEPVRVMALTESAGRPH